MKTIFIFIYFLALSSYAAEGLDFSCVMKKLSSDDSEVRKETQNKIFKYSPEKKESLLKLLLKSDDPEIKQIAATLRKTIPDPWRTYKGGVIEEECGPSALLTSENEVAKYIHKYKCRKEIIDFFKETDFKNECILFYHIKHRGSSSDAPAINLNYENRKIVCTVYDADTKGDKLMDNSRHDFYFILIIDRSRVDIVDIKDGMGITPGRKFFLKINSDIKLDDACKIIRGFAKHELLTKYGLLKSKTLSFSNYDLSVRDCKAISLLPNLVELDLSSTNVDHEMFEALTGSSASQEPTKIERLNLAHINLSEESLSVLSKFKNLRKLVIDTYWVKAGEKTDKFELLCDVSSLTELYLITPKISSEFFNKLPQLSNLKKLTIKMYGEKSSGWNKGFVNIGKTKLSYICLQYSYLEDIHMKSIAKIDSLSDLYIEGLNKVTDEGISFLKPLSKVENLSLSMCKINGTVLKELSHLPLKKLDLKGADIDNKTMQFIANNYRDLEQLNISYTKGLSSESIPFIKSLKKLKFLNVTNAFKGIWQSQLKSIFKGLTLYSTNDPFHN